MSYAIDALMRIIFTGIYFIFWKALFMASSFDQKVSQMEMLYRHDYLTSVIGSGVRAR